MCRLRISEVAQRIFINICFSRLQSQFLADLFSFIIVQKECRMLGRPERVSGLETPVSLVLPFRTVH